MAGPQGGLCEAARAGDLGLVKTLLEQGEQINQVEVFDIMNIWGIPITMMLLPWLRTSRSLAIISNGWPHIISFITIETLL